MSYKCKGNIDYVPEQKRECLVERGQLNQGRPAGWDQENVLHCFSFWVRASLLLSSRPHAFTLSSSPTCLTSSSASGTILEQW